MTTPTMPTTQTASTAAAAAVKSGMEYSGASEEWSKTMPKSCAPSMPEVNPPIFPKPVAVATTERSMRSRTISKP